MVIDTSALVAVLCNEPDAERYEEIIDRGPSRLMSVASALEAVIVLESRFGDTGAQELDLLIHRLPIKLVAVDLDQLEWARLAFRRFGRGRHPASLNFGDCFSYALAKVTGEPLLYKGNDFSQTDLPGALGVT
jgi:ribonuclease VapC